VIEKDEEASLLRPVTVSEEEKGWSRRTSRRRPRNPKPLGLCITVVLLLAGPIRHHRHTLGEPLNPLDMLRLAIVA